MKNTNLITQDQITELIDQPQIRRWECYCKLVKTIEGQVKKFTEFYADYKDFLTLESFIDAAASVGTRCILVLIDANNQKQIFIIKPEKS